MLCIFYYHTTPILKTLGQFENLVFVIMSTRENIRLIARSSLGMACSDLSTGYMNSGVFISKEHAKLAIKMHR